MCSIDSVQIGAMTAISLGELFEVKILEFPNGETHLRSNFRPHTRYLVFLWDTKGECFVARPKDEPLHFKRGRSMIEEEVSLERGYGSANAPEDARQTAERRIFFGS